VAVAGRRGNSYTRKDMASIWKGSVSFGLVNIPVELKTAVREDHISFRLLHEEDMSPVKYERVCQREGTPVPWNEIVKGYEYTKGKFVVLDEDDFQKAALSTSDTIDILDFVPAGEIDPRYFEKPYYLVPGKGGDKAYALLREALRATGMIGIGKVTIRQRQHLAGIKVVESALVLELMRFANELVEVEDLRFPAEDQVRPQELKMARQLVENLAEPFDASRYTDEYRANLMKIIQAKTKGKNVRLAEPERESDDAGVIDLMAKLQESLERGSRKGAKKSAPKKAAAKTGARKRKTA
jgi:DNA end-binding protein Ku